MAELAYNLCCAALSFGGSKSGLEAKLTVVWNVFHLLQEPGAHQNERKCDENFSLCFFIYSKPSS